MVGSFGVVGREKNLGVLWVYCFRLYGSGLERFFAILCFGLKGSILFGESESSNCSIIIHEL